MIRWDSPQWLLHWKWKKKKNTNLETRLWRFLTTCVHIQCYWLPDGASLLLWGACAWHGMRNIISLRILWAFLCWQRYKCYLLMFPYQFINIGVFKSSGHSSVYFCDFSELLRFLRRIFSQIWIRYSFPQIRRLEIVFDVWVLNSLRIPIFGCACWREIVYLLHSTYYSFLLLASRPQTEFASVERSFVDFSMDNIPISSCVSMSTLRRLRHYL